MNLSLALTFHCRSGEQAAALERVLTPDNKSIPKDQEFTASRNGSSLTFLISSPRPSSCISSALGLLSDAALFRDLWGLASPSSA